jgi:CRP-like cAMP-binding protein
MVRLKRSVLAFSKGETIFQEGQKVEGIYFILTGKVKVDMAWGDKKYIVRVANDGTILGHRGFGLDDVYPVNAVALETTTVCYITTALFQTLLKTNPTLLYELTFFYADELKRTERRMKNLAHMPVKGRVAESLLQLAQVFGTHADGQLAYSLSRKDLAAMSGSTYETVIRSLTELAQDGLITVKGKSISITDIPKLQACCNRATHAARE